ncbi:MAG TPA: hypothetical protein VFD03_09450 [Clostridia bacterium]|nr:hypothetical protein [Clostridia bacterium]
MDEKILEVPDDYEDKDYNEMNLTEKCTDFLSKNPLYNNVTFTPEQAAIAFIQVDDQIELINGKNHIVETMALCKHGCRY